jgi:uncharacterized membrane protein YqhA
MIRSALVHSRYIVVIAVLGTFVASLALLIYEAIVIAAAIVATVRE